MNLSHERRRCTALILPTGTQFLRPLVVARKTVYPAFNENETKLRVLVAAVALEMFPDVHGLFDEEVQILGKCWRESVLLQQTQDFVTSDALYLSNSMGITEKYPNGRWRETFLCELAAVLFDSLGLNIEPRGWGSLVRGENTRADALTFSVHASHSADA